MNFPWEGGEAAFGKAQGADRAKARDWSAVRAHAEAAVGKDPHHLDARHLLGVALAQLGEPAAAVEHLVAALAGDYHKYAPLLDQDEDLKELFATPHGASLRQVRGKIKAEYDRRIATGVLLDARRTSFRWPQKPGVEHAVSRGELYALDRETRHNGTGFNIKHVDQGGMSLQNMKARAEQINGYLKITSKPGDGTKVRVTVAREKTPNRAKNRQIQ